MAIKPLSAAVETTCVFPGDEAFDQEAREEEAGEDGERRLLTEVYSSKAATDPSCWRTLLKTVDGKQPTVFKLGPIPPAVLNRIEDDCKLRSMEFKRRTLYWECFKASLIGIENGPSERVKKNGSYIDEVPMVNGRVDGEWIDSTFVRGLRHVGTYVGMIAHAWNQLGDADVKN